MDSQGILVKVAIMAKALRILKDLINLQPFRLFEADYIGISEHGKLSDLELHRPLRDFCNCYLWSHSYGDPREVVEILLRKN
jgi:hypothetical protein